VLYCKMKLKNEEYRKKEVRKDRAISDPALAL
jgi:hypothetical protein